jgi:CRP-like cAMP-binding protein
MSAANAMQPSTIVRVDKETTVRLLHQEPEFAELFIAYLLSRNVRIEEDLVDQLFNSSEKRLARILLLLAHFGKDTKPESVVPKVSQETLAAMVGTTRSRVQLLHETGSGRWGSSTTTAASPVHNALLTVVLRD